MSSSTVVTLVKIKFYNEKSVSEGEDAGEQVSLIDMPLADLPSNWKRSIAVDFDSIWGETETVSTGLNWNLEELERIVASGYMKEQKMVLEITTKEVSI